MKKNNLYINLILILFSICSGANSLDLQGNFIQGGLVFVFRKNFLSRGGTLGEFGAKKLLK